MGNILIGWSEVNITPDKPIKLAGQFFDRVSEYVETPVTVTAMAIKSGEEQAIFCSCDLVSVPLESIEDVRLIVQQKNKQIDISKIIISATHTHTSHQFSKGISTTKSLDKFLPQGKKIDPFKDVNYMDGEESAEYLSNKIAEAVLKAWADLKPSKIASEFGRAIVGHCRRVCYDDGTAKMWGNTDSAIFSGMEGGNDSGIELLYIFDNNDRLKGIVINVACPSQVVEHRSFISSDYWGKVKILLREKFGNGLFVLCQCSAAGDQCPRDLVRWIEPKSPTNDPNIKRDYPKKRKGDCSMFDIEGTWEIGKRITNAVIERYDYAKENASEELVFIHKTQTINLPLRKVRLKEYEKAIEKLNDFLTTTQNKVYDALDRNNMHLTCGIIDRYKLQQESGVVPIELHVIRLGDIVFCTNPFELFLNYGLRIKARSIAEQTFLIQLCGGSLGYLPTEIAEKGGHYSAYVTSGFVGHEGGSFLVDVTLDKIRNIFTN